MTKKDFSIRHTAASINATVLGILIALVAAYAIYVNDSLRNAEFEAIAEAERINQVFFARSAYYPKNLAGLATIVNSAIDIQRKEMSIQRNQEPVETSLSLPATPKDLEELSRYLQFLCDPFWTMHKKDEEYAIGNNKFLPRDAANRDEEVLRVLNLMGHCHLFPDPPFETDATFSKLPPRKKYFKDIKGVATWLDGVETFLFEVKKLRFNMAVFESNAVPFRRLLLRDSKLINKWESSTIMKGYGRLDPNYLFSDFLATSRKVQHVAEETRYKANRFQKLRERYPPSIAFTITLFFIAFLLVLGVVLPLTSSRVPTWLYLHVPLWSSIIIYAIIALLLAMR